jgi:hypothetical protein
MPLLVPLLAGALSIAALADPPVPAPPADPDGAFVPFLDRWSEVCPADGQAPRLDWLSKYDERCALVLRASGPDARPDEASLEDYRRGYKSAQGLYKVLARGAWSKTRDFEQELGRRTDRMMPDYGTKTDSKLRVVNVIYVYLGSDAVKELIGPDGKGGKLDVVRRLEHPKDRDARPVTPDEMSRYFDGAAQAEMADGAVSKGRRKESEKKSKALARSIEKGLMPLGDGVLEAAGPPPGGVLAASPGAAPRSGLAAPEKAAGSFARPSPPEVPSPPGAAKDAPKEIPPYVPSDDLARVLKSLPATDTGRKDRPASPLILVFIGSKPQISYVLKSAHWVEVPRNGFLNVFEGLGQMIGGANITKFPPFRRFHVEGKNEDMNWAQVVHAITKRHHFRLWKLKDTAPDGRQIWWGSGSYDVGINWRHIINPTHAISPDISAERDFIARSLLTAPGVVRAGLTALPQIPREGVNDEDGAYFTDGRALVVEFSGAAPVAAADPGPDLLSD